MVNNRNTSIFKNIHDRLNIRDGNFFDNVMPNHITPVLEVDKPTAQIVKFNSASNATSATIYTTPTDKDFYVSTVVLTATKDVTSTSVRSAILCTIDGVQTRLAHINFTTLVAQNTASVSVSFPIPIKIDRNTNITVTNSTNVANVMSDGLIVGYLSDTLQY